MYLDIHDDQLTPVTDNVRVGLLRYNPRNPKHEAVLREAMLRFLAPEGAGHGLDYPKEYMDAVVTAANAGQVAVHFPVAVFGGDRALLAGIMTEVPSFASRLDENGKLQIVPCLHAEDTSLDRVLAQKFREHTRSLMNPKGIGFGTCLVGLRTWESVKDKNWVCGLRENEYADDNPPIKGLMDKLGAKRGTPATHPILQVDGFMSNFDRKWWVKAETLALPADASRQIICPNNYATRWISDCGTQQVDFINTLITSTFTAKQTNWLKISTTGNLQNGNGVEDVLTAMLIASFEEMTDRRWGMENSRTGNDLSALVGSGTNVRLHVHDPIVASTLYHDMKIGRRTFGEKPMLSGLIDHRNIPDPQSLLGQDMPPATSIDVIDPVGELQKPIVDFVSKPIDLLTQDFDPTRPFDSHDNDNIACQALKAA